MLVHGYVQRCKQVINLLNKTRRRKVSHLGIQCLFGQQRPIGCSQDCSCSHSGRPVIKHATSCTNKPVSQRLRATQDRSLDVRRERKKDSILMYTNEQELPWAVAKMKPMALRAARPAAPAPPCGWSREEKQGRKSKGVTAPMRHPSVDSTSSSIRRMDAGQKS